MQCQLEYLEEKGEMNVQGVGTFGIMQIPRKKLLAYRQTAHKARLSKKPAPAHPKPERLTMLPCTEATARQFANDKDEKRFRVHGLPADDAACCAEDEPEGKPEGKKKSGAAAAKGAK